MSKSVHGQKKKIKGKRQQRREIYDNEIKSCVARYNVIQSVNCNKFSDLPLSAKTRDGLETAGFVSLTDIQRESIPHCLRGTDVMAEAVTGSGKTLAFLVPVLECLWREKWSQINGVGALIVTPTRELAYQIYEVLKKVGCKHEFSAGLIIGGKSIEEERRRIPNTNIIIATPGRLLQHMDETAGFNCDNLQVLVLDEADRILDLGFSVAMKHILENIPSDRQTLLFSATQTPQVAKLASISLKNKEEVSTNKNKTPIQLSHYYVVVQLQEKLELLYSFIKSHLNSKILVFMSSCKQVQFHNAVLCKLRPGLPILALYGKQKQLRRVGVYEAFCNKKAAVLLATDIAARGLDIPAVHWVIHLDCPEDVQTYIHRSGRTARYNKSGNSLAMLLPSELEMEQKLSKESVSLTSIRINPNKQLSVQKKVQALCAEDPDIHHWARKCFVSYVRSVFLQGDKSVFDVKALPLEPYAASLGMLTAPKVRFLKKAEKSRGATTELKDEDDLNSKEKLDIPSESDDEEFLTKKSDHENKEVMEDLSVEQLELPMPRNLNQKPKSKVAKAKALIRKGITANTKITFDEEGNVDKTEGAFERRVTKDITPISNPAQAGGIDISEVQTEMVAEDKRDKIDQRDKRKTLKRLKKEKRKRENDAEHGGVTLQCDSDSAEEAEPDSEVEEKPKRAKTQNLNQLKEVELLAQQLLGD